MYVSLRGLEPSSTIRALKALAKLHQYAGSSEPLQSPII